MCGIFGSSGTNGLNLQEAGYLMRRRGPDDHGSWIEPNGACQLGQVRLSIIDTSADGHQPMVSRNGRVVMVYNGELYNYRELRTELEAVGVRFQSRTDSEVLLELFARHGSAAFGRMNGIFAVALWERDREVLTLARDLMGVKPLYVAERPGGFAFASEMKALLRSGFVAAELDPAAVLAHIGYVWSPGSRTIVRGIRKVLPGQVMEVRAGEVVKEWFYDDLRYKEEVPASSPERVIAKVADTVRQAVERQLVADVPLGSFLSGGLDSSAIVAFAQRRLQAEGRQRLQCYTIEVSGGAMGREGFADDLPYARQVAKHVGADLHVVKAGEEMVGRLAEMVYLLDEPTADPAGLNTLLIAEMARRDGIKVLLSGAGGDDVFTGYRRHFALQQERWWRGLPQPVRAMGARVARTLPAAGPLGRRVRKAFAFADGDADHRLASYFLWIEPDQALSLLAPEFRQSLTAGDLYAPLLASLARLPLDTAPLNRMLYLECKHFLADHNLHYADKMGMAAGLEIRVPLLDLDLVNLVNSLPIGLKQRGATGKWILRKAMEPYLPHDVIYRGKTGFGVPLRGWLRGPLAGLVDDLLAKPAIRRRGIFDAERVSQLVALDRSGRTDASYTIFGLVCLELWCRQHLDGAYAVDPELHIV